MIFKKSFKFRLCPNQEQANLCLQFAGASHGIYNRALDQRDKLWKEQKRSISLYTQNNELVALKEEEKTQWLKSIHSQVLQQALQDLSEASNYFFRRVKNHETPGYPQFRCKGENDSFRYPQGELVWLPKIGWVKFRKSRKIEGKIKQTTVIKESEDWYVCFSCEREKEASVAVSTDAVIGIDVGLENFATNATKDARKEIENPCFLEKRLPKMQFLQRSLSRKQKRSKNRLKAKSALSKEHARVKNQRKDFQHKLSTELVKSHDKIVIENLAVKELLEKVPTDRARAISDAGWRGFLHMVQYKCKEYGKKLLEASRYFPSTKQCYNYKKINDIPLNQRIYSCNCGHQMHRHNAAFNLRAAGMSV